MTGEVWDQIHDLWFTRIVVLPQGHRGFRWYCLNVMTFHYAPNFEKVGSILLSACPSVRASVRPCVCPFKKIKARVLKFHIWIPRQK